MSELKEKMVQKLTERQLKFSDTQVRWLMENIGNPDPEIRDKIVYMLLTRGIDEGAFSGA